MLFMLHDACLANKGAYSSRVNKLTIYFEWIRRHAYSVP